MSRSRAFAFCPELPHGRYLPRFKEQQCTIEWMRAYKSYQLSGAHLQSAGKGKPKRLQQSVLLQAIACASLKLVKVPKHPPNAKLITAPVLANPTCKDPLLQPCWPRGALTHNLEKQPFCRIEFCACRGSLDCTAPAASCRWTCKRREFLVVSNLCLVLTARWLNANPKPKCS